ncbi:NrfD/PsrC family molybdoenzyme membrane anchor subunit [Falsiroseomonas sp. HW251]|uniref:NrfD/PsrC family molybdoenzyme membrane anchor subunit n=1 Tax=Falsiroseomonas sp. HW251 TaxID=3390998 RepID=UPI003D312919
MSAVTQQPLPSQASYGELVGVVADPLLERRPGRGWWIALGIGTALTLVLLGAMAWLFIQGIGIWGVDTTVVWGFAIANFVWWLGIGHAGTLISSLLLLTRQRWRASVNRFAEAMTLFAASIAGLFPILHLGRPYRFYWLVPYPNSMQVWPQWRSALVWDFAAISTYLIFSLLFWYWGLIPDLATLRDRARNLAWKRVYGVLSLGWRGSARHWQLHGALYGAMAAIGLPLVVSVHSIVGMDFAASLMPGWQETIFPPYFVVGALFSGFAMAVTIAVILRAALGLQEVIRAKHFDAMSKILLAGSIAMGFSYATEWFNTWYGGGRAETEHLRFLFAGEYAPFYILMLCCNVVAPQILWWPRARVSMPILLVLTLVINLGMWLERVLIVITTLSHAHLPSMRAIFVPTIWDWLTLAGSIGFFVLLFVAFVRLFPVVAMHDLGKRLRQEKEEMA